MLSKIIIPVDSIELDNTLNAVKTAITLSRGCRVREEPELIFLHFVHMKPRISMSERKRLSEMEKEKIKEEFEKIKEMCKNRGLKKVRTIQKEGNPSAEIVELAQEEDADLIAMGSGKLHDKSAAGRLHKFFYGSVTEDVIHKAPCSVLVTRPKMDLEKALVPVDSMEWDNTMMSIKNAIEFAGGCKGGMPKLIFMHVLNPPSGPELSEERLELERKRIQNEFETIKEMCEEGGISNFNTITIDEGTEREREVDEEIVRVATERDVDIIIMGSGKLHDRSTGGKIQKFIYGSVTEKVIRESPCSIMITRPLS